MPLPTPHKGEEKQDFISRCAGNDVMNKEYTDDKQKLAVCYSQWRRKHESDGMEAEEFRLMVETGIIDSPELHSSPPHETTA